MSNETTEISRWLELSADPDSDKDDCSLKTFKSKWKSRYGETHNSEVYSSNSSLSQYSLDPDTPQKDRLGYSQTSVDDQSGRLSEYNLSSRKSSCFADELSSFDDRKSSQVCDLTTGTLISERKIKKGSESEQNSLNVNDSRDLCLTFPDLSQYSLGTNECAVLKTGKNKFVEKSSAGLIPENKERPATKINDKYSIDVEKLNVNESIVKNKSPQHNKDSKIPNQTSSGGQINQKYCYNSREEKKKSEIRSHEKRKEQITKKCHLSGYQEKLVYEQKLYEQAEQLRLRSRQSTGKEKSNLNSAPKEQGCQRQLSGSRIPRIQTSPNNQRKNKNSPDSKKLESHSKVEIHTTQASKSDIEILFEKVKPKSRKSVKSSIEHKSDIDEQHRKVVLQSDKTIEHNKSSVTDKTVNNKHNKSDLDKLFEAVRFKTRHREDNNSSVNFDKASDKRNKKANLDNFCEKSKNTENIFNSSATSVKSNKSDSHLDVKSVNKSGLNCEELSAQVQNSHLDILPVKEKQHSYSNQTESKKSRQESAKQASCLLETKLAKDHSVCEELQTLEKPQITEQRLLNPITKYFDTSDNSITKNNTQNSEKEFSDDVQDILKFKENSFKVGSLPSFDTFESLSSLERRSIDFSRRSSKDSFVYSDRLSTYSNQSLKDNARLSSASHTSESSESRRRLHKTLERSKPSILVENLSIQNHNTSKFNKTNSFTEKKSSSTSCQPITRVETQTQNLNVPERSLIVNEQSKCSIPKKVNFDNNTTQFEALEEDKTLDMDSTLVSSLSGNHGDSNTEVETKESPDVSPSVDQTETKNNLNYEEIEQAIMEISSEFISGNLSSGNLVDEDSDSSHLSSDFESRRLKSSVAKYPENASGLSDNDWNPYTTESDSNLTPRLEPQANKITRIAETESEVVKEQHFNGKESDISSFSPQLSSSKFINNENTDDKPTPPVMDTVKEETKSEISNFSPTLTSSRAQTLKHDPVSSYFPASTSHTSSLMKASSTNSTPNNLSNKSSSSIIEFSPLLSSTVLNSTHMQQQANRFNVTLSDVSEATEHNSTSFKELKEVEASTVLSDKPADIVDNAADLVNGHISPNALQLEDDINDKAATVNKDSRSNTPPPAKVTAEVQPEKEVTEENQIPSSGIDSNDGSPCLDGSVPDLIVQKTTTNNEEKLEVDQKKQEKPMKGSSSNTSTIKEILSSETPVDLKSTDQIREDANKLLENSLKSFQNSDFNQQTMSLPGNTTKTNLNTSYSKSMDDLTKEDASQKINGKKCASTDNLDRIRISRTDPNFLANVGEYLATFPYQSSSRDTASKTKPMPSNRTSFGSYTQSSLTHGYSHSSGDRFSNGTTKVSDPDRVEPQTRLSNGTGRFTSVFGQKFVAGAEARDLLESKDSSLGNQENTGSRDKETSYQSGSLQSKVEGILTSTAYLEQMKKDNPLIDRNFSISPQNSPEKQMDYKKIQLDLLQIQKSLTNNKISDLSIKSSFDSGCSFSNQNTMQHPESNTSTETKTNSLVEVPKDPQHSSDAESTDIVPSTTSSTPEKTKKLMWDYAADIGYDDTGLFIGRNSGGSMEQPILSGNIDLPGSRLNQMRTSIFSINQRRSDSQAFVNCDQVDKNASRRTRYCSEGEETRTSSSSGHVDGDVSDKTESEVTLTEQDIDEPTRDGNEINNVNILQTINQRHSVDNLIEALRSQRQAVEERYRTTGRYFSGQPHPNQSVTQHAPVQTQGLANQVQSILKKDNPSTQADGYLNDVFNQEKDLREKIFKRVFSDSSFSDTSLGLDDSSQSFTMAMDTVRRRLDLSNIPVTDTQQKPPVPRLDLKGKMSALSNVESALTSHSMDYRTPKKHVIQCYPVYGYQKDQQNQPENKYETRPIREGPVVRSDDPSDMWPQSGQVTNVARDFESMGDSNFADKTNVTDSQFTSLRTETSLTTVTSEKSQSDMLSESGAETSISTTDRRSASSPSRERGKSSPDWQFRHPEIPDLGGPVNSRRTAVHSTTDKEDIKERQSPVSPRYTSQDSDSSGIKPKSRFRPYRASSGHPFIESDTASIADSITTVESTHTGSDDAQGPDLPRAVLGSRPDPKQQSGIYSKQTHQMSTLVTEPALSTIEEKSVTDEKSVESTKSSGSDQSIPRKPDDRQQIDSGLYSLSHGGHTINQQLDSGLYTLPHGSRTINQQADSGIHTLPHGTQTLNQQLNSGLYNVPQGVRPVDQQDDSGAYTVSKGGRTTDQHVDSRLYTVSQGGRSTGQQSDSLVYSLPQGGRTMNQQTLPQGNEMEEGVYSSLEGLIYDNEPDGDDVYSSLQDDSRNVDQQLVDENDYLIPQIKHKIDTPSQEQRSVKRNLFESNDQYRQSTNMEPQSPHAYEDVSDFKKTHGAMVQDVRNQRIMGSNPSEYSPGRHQKRESARRSPFDDLYKAPPAQTHLQSQRSNSPYFEDMQFESNGHQIHPARSKLETENGYPGHVSPSGARSPSQVVSRDRGQYRDVDQQRLVEERESRQRGRPLSPIAMDTRNSPVSYIQNEKPDYTGSRLSNGTNDEIIMKPTKRTERRKNSERKRPQYGHDSTSEEEYLRGLDRTPHSLRAQRLRQALEQEIAQTHPQDLPAVWRRFSEIMPSEAESQVNPVQSEVYASLVTHPTKPLISQYFNEREKSRQILEDRLAEEREYRHRQALNRPKKMSSSEDQLNSANFEQINASYAEILEALAAERAKRLHRETKAKSHSRSSQKQKHEKHSKTSKRASQHLAENSETLYAIPEDQSNDTLAATSNSQSQDSRDLSVSDPMSTLKSKIRRQRDKIEKERRRELKRMEKLWKLEQLLKAKKSGLIGNFVLANNMNSISSTSTAASFSESPELLSGESTLTLSAHSGDISEDMSTTVKDSSYEAHRVKLNRSKQKNAEEQYEAALRYLLSSGSSATLTDGEDSPSWLIKEEKKRRKMEKARSPKDKGKEKPVKLKEKGRKIVETRPKNHSSPYRLKDRKQKSPKKPESFEISPVKWDRESTRMSSPHKSSRSASLLHSLARDISPVKSSSKSTRRSRDPSHKHHEESHRARSISPDRHHRSRGVQTSPKMRSRSCSPTYGDLQIISVPVLKKGKHGTRAVFMPRMYSSDMRENIPPKRIKKREKPKPPVSWYIPLTEEKRNMPNPLQERPPETQITDQRRGRGEWGMNNDQLKSPGWTIDARVDRQEKLDRQDKQDRLEQPVDNNMELLPLKPCITLQEALLLNKKDFISQSRERQKRIALASEHRQMQDYLEAERDRIFGDRKRKGRQIEYPSGYKAETLYKFPKKKLFTKQEMKAITHRLYRRLPEVKYRELMEKRRQQYKLNRLRAMVFNRKVQNNVLRRAGIIA